MTEFHTSIAEQITTSVGIAMEAAKATIAEQISASMDEALRKSKEEQEVTRFQLEGRITRTKENLDGLITVIRNDHAKFQSEMRTTVASLQPVNPDHRHHQR